MHRFYIKYLLHQRIHITDLTAWVLVLSEYLYSSALSSSVNNRIIFFGLFFNFSILFFLILVFLRLFFFLFFLIFLLFFFIFIFFNLWLRYKRCRLPWFFWLHWFLGWSSFFLLIFIFLFFFFINFIPRICPFFLSFSFGLFIRNVM